MSVGRDIVKALTEWPARSVALTVETDISLIRGFVGDLLPDIVHLCGDTTLVGPDEVEGLWRWMSTSGIDAELMQAIGVSGPASVDLAVEFEPHVDWLILDSVTDAVDGIGAAGFTHDWDVSRRIVEVVSVPVILAGGLGPDNVAEAIAAVGPEGVDSLTGTNQFGSDGSFIKDLEAVNLFVEAARGAVREM